MIKLISVTAALSVVLAATSADAQAMEPKSADHSGRRVSRQPIMFQQRVGSTSADRVKALLIAALLISSPTPRLH